MWTKNKELIGEKIRGRTKKNNKWIYTISKPQKGDTFTSRDKFRV
jgi:hypothetical protein